MLENSWHLTYTLIWLVVSNIIPQISMTSQTSHICEHRFPAILSETHRKMSDISRTKLQNSYDSRLVLHLSLPSSLKPGVRARMKMQLSALLQLHLSDQQFHCQLRYYGLYETLTVLCHYQCLPKKILILEPHEGWVIRGVLVRFA